MLGIRHFHGCAIDLFLGDIAEFSCDMIAFVGDLDSLGSVESGKKLVSLLGQEGLAKLMLTDAGDLPAQNFIFSPVSNPQDRLDVGASYKAALESASQLAMRHLAILVSSPNLAEFVLQQLKVWIEARLNSPMDVKRISFILKDQHSYTSYQKELFKQFPEE